MPVTVAWDDEARTIIHWSYVGKWSWSETSYAFEDTIRMMNEVRHPVSLIHDLTQSAGIPASAIHNAYRYTSSLPENWLISVVVDNGGFAEALLNIFRTLYKKMGERYKTAHTLDEARRIIEYSSRKPN